MAMGMASENQENVKGLNRAWNWLIEKPVDLIVGAAKDAKKLGLEDPRRIVHSLKVGLAITLVSLFYYFDFLYEGFGVAAMWAVITVVVVFEFSVGATLGKGVNRGIATLLGGALGVAAHRLSSFAGEKAESIILGSCVFLIAAVVTFLRFFPNLKARYDYGLLIFILSFCLISVSGYREDEVIKMAYRRLSTIVIGGSATVLICILIYPVWAGADLHHIIAFNIEKLGVFLEGFGHEYFLTRNGGDQKKKEWMDGYKSVINSKSIEEAMVNFAKWEPRHGKFRYRHPWDQYLKIGSLTRECSYKIDALNSYLNSEIETQNEIRAKIQDSCTRMSLECSYALRELALGMKTMTCSLSADSHIVNAKSAAKMLKAQLKTSLWAESNILDIVPTATVASLLIEIVYCTVRIADSVHELSSLANFKIPKTPKTDQQDPGRVSRTPSMEESRNFRRVTRNPSIQESHSFNIVVE